MNSLIKVIFIMLLALPFASFSEDTSTKVEDPKPLLGRVLGDKNAKIVIEEYASMSCGHCAKFHIKELEDIQENFIKTGKAKLIFYDFPLDPRATFASMLTQCMDTDEQFFLVQKALFEKQTDWTSADWKTHDDIINSFANILIPVGLSKDTIKSCLIETTENTKRWKSLEAGREYAIKMKDVQATPTFFVNGKKVEGLNIKKLKELLN